MPEGLVVDTARLSEHSGRYASLGLFYGSELPESQPCPAHRVAWPANEFDWVQVGRPGGWERVTFEELDGIRWSLEA
eukprot:11182247-Lingulodinium_polyedra.AAC.1